MEKTNDVNLRLKIMNAIKNNEMSLHEYYCAIPDTYNNQLTSFTKLGKMEHLLYNEVRKSGIEKRLKHLSKAPKKLHEIANPHLFNEEEKQELNLN